jgi:hypothetical protein
MVINASFYLNNKLYVISNGGYAYVFYEKDGRQKIRRISAREFEDRRAERYDPNSTFAIIMFPADIKY